MRIGLLTTLWMRPSLTRLVLSYYASLDLPGIELVRVCSHTPGDRQEIPGAWHVVEAPNVPLGKKFNAALAWLETQSIDALIIVGSDDLLSAGYFTFAASCIEAGYEYIVPGGMYLYDLATGRMTYMLELHLGAGRVLTADLLERLGWIAWFDDHRRIDHGQELLLQPHVKSKHKVEDPAAEDLAIVGLKSRVNRWSYDHLVSCANEQREEDPGEVFHRFFPQIADRLLKNRTHYA